MDDTLVGALQNFFMFQMSDVYTAIPCRVEKVDSAEEARVTVKPLIKQLLTDGTSVERPVLLGVPLMTLASGSSVVHLPVNEGDTVLCVFSMRGLDAFKSGSGEIEAPTDFRVFDKRDAIAIPGLFPFSEHPNQRVAAFDPTALSITHNVGTPLEATVSIDAAGQINLNSPLKVSITAPVVSINGV